MFSRRVNTVIKTVNLFLYVDFELIIQTVTSLLNHLSILR